jgi:hypothetical protein
MLENVSFNKKKQNIKIRNKLLRNLPKLNAELNEAYKKMKRNVKTFLNKKKIKFYNEILRNLPFQSFRSLNTENYKKE